MLTLKQSLTLAALSLFVVGSNPACRLIGGAASGTSSPNRPSQGTGGGEGLLTLLGADPPTLDPAIASDSSSSVYIVEIFSGLATLDRDLKVVPDLADRWEVSQDGKTYTFYIKKDAKFHDGKQVTANDFKWSMERAANPRTASPVADTYLGDIVGVTEMLANRAQNISGIRVVDDTTLQITIDEPKSYFLSKLTYPTAFVLDQANVTSGGRTWTDKPNGTGPFKLREWRKGQNIILDRNENYPTPALLKTANFILSGGSAMTMYENNEIDVSYVSLTDSDRVLDPKNALFNEVLKGPDGKPGTPELSVFYIGFNTKQAPYDDPKVRQAFSAAIDKDRIIDVVLRNLADRADGILPPGIPGFNKDLRPIKYDVSRAKQLLAESKYPDLSRYDIVITTPGAGANPSRTVQAYSEMWKTAFGVEVKIEQVEWATFLDDVHNKKYGMFDLGWIADYPDPQNFLDINLYSKSSNNNSSYNNPQFDSLIEQARRERDEQARLKLYQQAEQIAVDDAVWIPLFYNRDFTIVKPYVKNYIKPPITIPVLKYVSVQK